MFGRRYVVTTVAPERLVSNRSPRTNRTRSPTPAAFALAVASATSFSSMSMPSPPRAP